MSKETKSRKDNGLTEPKDRKVRYQLTRKTKPLLLGKNMDRLNFEKTQTKLGPEWRCRVFNDRGDNLRNAIDMGYVFVQGDDDGGLTLIDEPKKLGDTIYRHVGTDADGDSIRGYLMACPTEVFEKRFAAEQAIIKEREKLIKKPKEQDGQYGSVETIRE